MRTGLAAVTAVLLGAAVLAPVRAASRGSVDVIASDSAGLVVMVKEKYGMSLTDTCTVVMLYRGNFVLVRREGGARWFPVSFHSVSVLKHLGTAGAGPAQEQTESTPLAATTSSGTAMTTSQSTKDLRSD